MQPKESIDLNEEYDTFISKYKYSFGAKVLYPSIFIY